MSQHRLGRCPCCEHGGIKNVVELLAENNIMVEGSHNDLILSANLPSSQPSRGEYSTAQKLLPPKVLGLTIPEPDLDWSNFVHKGIRYTFYWLLNRMSYLILGIELILFGIGLFTAWEWYDDFPIMSIVIVVLPFLVFVLTSYSDKKFKQIQRDNQKNIEEGRRHEEEKYNREQARRQKQIATYQRLIYCYTCQKFFDPVVIKGQKRCWKPREMANFLGC